MIPTVRKRAAGYQIPRDPHIAGAKMEDLVDATENMFLYNWIEQTARETGFPQNR